MAASVEMVAAIVKTIRESQYERYWRQHYFVCLFAQPHHLMVTAVIAVEPSAIGFTAALLLVGHWNRWSSPRFSYH